MAGEATAPLRSDVAEYGQSHQASVNQVLHDAGIPMLAVGILGLLGRVRVGRVAADDLALLGAGTWYLGKGGAAGLPPLAGLAGCAAVGRLLPTGVLAGLAGTGAVVHAIGHRRFEGKPPAFLKDPTAVLAAPVWLLGRWAAAIGGGKGAKGANF